MRKRITAYNLGTIGIASHMHQPAPHRRPAWPVVVLIVALALCVIALLFAVAPSVAHAQGNEPPRTSGPGDASIQEQGREVARVGVDAYARQGRVNTVLPETGADLTGATLIAALMFVGLGLVVITLAIAWRRTQ